MTNSELKTINDFPYSEMVRYDLERAVTEWIKKLRINPKNDNIITWIIHFFQINNVKDTYENRD